MKNMTRKYTLNQSPFYKLSSKKKLAKLLYISHQKLKLLTQSESLYREWKQKNKNKKPRIIEEPQLQLKLIQKRIADLLGRIETPEFLFCPGKGKGYISNAKAHIDNTVVHILDIKKFFNSTSSWRVYWFFSEKMKCSSDIAGILTKLSTFKGHLPTGSPLSPIMSYYSHVDMWDEINKIVSDAQCTLTVYMDDLTVSGTSIPIRTIWQIKKQIYRCSLRYHKERCYRGKIRKVTGVILKDAQLKLPNKKHLEIKEVNQQRREKLNPEKRNKLLLRKKGLQAQALQIARSNTSVVRVK